MAITCSTAGYLQINDAIGCGVLGGTVDFMWLYQTALALHSMVISGNSNSSVNSSFNMRVSATGFGQNNATDSGAVPLTTTTITTALALNTWTSFCSANLGITSRRIVMNGVSANATTSIASATITSPVSWTRIGGRFGNSQCVNTASMAEWSRWNCAGWTATDVDALALKLTTLVGGLMPNPLNVNVEVGQVWSGKLLCYYPFTTVAGLVDSYLGVLTLVATSSGGQPATSGVAHPSVEAYSPGGSAAFLRKKYRYRNMGLMA